jgi:hypothetical protein
MIGEILCAAIVIVILIHFLNRGSLQSLKPLYHQLKQHLEGANVENLPATEGEKYRLTTKDPTGKKIIYYYHRTQRSRENSSRLLEKIRALCPKSRQCIKLVFAVNALVRWENDYDNGSARNTQALQRHCATQLIKIVRQKLKAARTNIS